MFQFQQKLKHIKAQFKTWNKAFFGNIQIEKAQLEEQLTYLQRLIMQEGYNEDTKTKEEKLQEVLDKREQ